MYRNIVYVVQQYCFVLRGKKKKKNVFLFLCHLLFSSFSPYFSCSAKTVHVQRVVHNGRVCVILQKLVRFRTVNSGNRVSCRTAVRADVNDTDRQYISRNADNSLSHHFRQPWVVKCFYETSTREKCKTHVLLNCWDDFLLAKENIISYHFTRF